MYQKTAGVVLTFIFLRTADTANIRIECANKCFRLNGASDGASLPSDSCCVTFRKHCSTRRTKSIAYSFKFDQKRRVVIKVVEPIALFGLRCLGAEPIERISDRNHKWDTLMCQIHIIITMLAIKIFSHSTLDFCFVDTQYIWTKFCTGAEQSTINTKDNNSSDKTK